MPGHPRYTRDQIAERARELYERQIRAQVEPENTGKYLVIDIESGEYELDEDKFAASDRAHAKHPDGALYAMRIGYRYRRLRHGLRVRPADAAHCAGLLGAAPQRPLTRLCRSASLISQRSR